MNGEAVYTAIGQATFTSSNRSLTVPPATLRKAELQKPVIKRKMRYTAENDMVRVALSRTYYRGHLHICGAKATGKENAKKRK